ncbi:hypothetical protein [Aquella oligotrophica]|uniref:Outer membrane protein beta-barrel domain-containing protein n=1 Tax=Aquella oligotrophica TaxID=2067065 RepID=A0A2I7N878_9NEIS|nr:hypothetical protein [Aquella oligotrophica]AUR52663.1 hypothetical protein CUN60_10260 [Aquella oligotrophica]
MRKLISIILAATAGIAYADDAGVYINANAGINTGSNYQFAYNANAGYMFNRYLGVEAGFTGASTSYWDAAIKGVLPIPIVDIYGRLGMSYVNNYGSTSGAVLYGVGVAFPILPYIRINIEDYAISNASTQNFLMGGLEVKF